MDNKIFDDTQIAFKMKKNFHLYNAIFLFNIITRKILVTVFTNLTLVMLKMNLPIKWILKKTIYKISSLFFLIIYFLDFCVTMRI